MRLPATNTASHQSPTLPHHGNNPSSTAKPKRALHLLRNRGRLCMTTTKTSVLRHKLVIATMLLFAATTIHRSISTYMARKTWWLAPTPLRTCPPPTYPTLGMSTPASSSDSSDSSRSESTALEDKICLTTLTDEHNKAWATRTFGWRNFDGLLDLTWENKQRYADRHGYRLFNESFAVDKSRPPSWSKIRAAQRLLREENCSWVFWMDADTVIMNSDKRIEDFLPAIDDDGSSKDLILSGDNGGGYNAGAWLIRNSEWSLEFLETWWNMKSFIRPPGLSHSGDNAALKHYMQKLETTSDEFDKHVVAPPRCTFNSFAKFLTPTEYEEAMVSTPDDIKAQDWYMAEGYYHRGDLLAHVAGVDNKVTTLKMLLELAQ